MSMKSSILGRSSGLGSYYDPRSLNDFRKRSSLRGLNASYVGRRSGISRRRRQFAVNDVGMRVDQPQK